MIAFRSMDERDERFVVDSFVKSYRDSRYAGLIQMDSWFPVMLRQIRQLLRHPHVRVLVAFDPTETDRVADISGWLCYEPETERHSPLLYYVFVKTAYRRKGIARKLLEQAHIELDRPFRYACSTYVIDNLEKDKRWHQIAPYATFDVLAGRH